MFAVSSSAILSSSSRQPTHVLKLNLSDHEVGLSGLNRSRDYNHPSSTHSPGDNAFPVIGPAVRCPSRSKPEDFVPRVSTTSCISYLVLNPSASPHHDRNEWNGILLSPFARLLTLNDPLCLVASVALDVATAIDKCCSEHHILQRDITPRNFGLHEKRGYLFDFSVAIKVGGASVALYLLVIFYIYHVISNM